MLPFCVPDSTCSRVRRWQEAAYLIRPHFAHSLFAPLFATATGPDLACSLFRQHTYLLYLHTHTLHSGSKLLAAAEEEAKRRGARGSYLDTVRSLSFPFLSFVFFVFFFPALFLADDR